MVNLLNWDNVDKLESTGGKNMCNFRVSIKAGENLSPEERRKLEQTLLHRIEDYLQLHLSAEVTILRLDHDGWQDYSK